MGAAKKKRKTLFWVIDGQDYTCEIEDEACPFCLKSVVVRLPPPVLAQQPDDTTHVCHPTLGGCNHGFAKEAHRAARTYSVHDVDSHGPRERGWVLVSERIGSDGNIEDVEEISSHTTEREALAALAKAQS